jgi:hypothetical protein
VHWWPLEYWSICSQGNRRTRYKYFLLAL